MLNCDMVWFPASYYWHCNWPVQKASPGMCLCKWWTFWTLFVNKLLQTICIFHVFLVQVASIHCISFLLCWYLMVNRPTTLNCKASSLLWTVNKQKVKYWYFAWCYLRTYFNDIWYFFYLLARWQKVTFETCFTCMRIANFWFLGFPR